MMNIHLIFYLLNNKMEFVEKVLITLRILDPEKKQFLFTTVLYHYIAVSALRHLSDPMYA